MERLTDRSNNQNDRRLSCMGRCYNAGDCINCDSFANAVDRLAAYEDAEEQGSLVRVKDREVIRRALARYCHYLESELYERLTHGESNGVKELQKEIALVEAALKES